MTCIAGVTNGTSVWIGVDSWGGNSYGGQTRADEKLFRRGPFLIGYTTSFRMGQLLRFSFEAPTPTSRAHTPTRLRIRSDFEFMATTFVDALRASFRKGGILKVEHQVEEGGTFLVGYRGGLYRIDSDFQVGIPLERYAAVGCAEQFALGALHATRNQAPKRRIEAALAAAEAHCGNVRGPFTISRV